MKIQLITPPGNSSQRMFSMSEAGNLLAFLRRSGHTVRLLDGVDYSNHLSGALGQVSDFSPALVVFLMSWDIDVNSAWTASLLSTLKRCAPGVHVCAAGRKATVYYEQILSANPQLDTVVLGEPEMTVSCLAEFIEDGSDSCDVEGIAFRSGAHITVSRRNAIANLDSLPIADHEYLRNRRVFPIAPISTSRECYGRCSFCPTRVYREATPSCAYRAKSAEAVLEELDLLVREYGVGIVYFVDDNFFVDGQLGKQRAVDIAEGIQRRGLRIRFYIECRANDIEAELFHCLKAAGLRKVLLGLESGSESMLSRFTKGITPQQNIEALNMLRALHINVDPGFIMWDPGMSLGELEQNLDFLDTQHLGANIHGDLLFSRLILYPGTPLTRRYESGALYRDDRVTSLMAAMQYVQTCSSQSALHGDLGLSGEKSYAPARKLLRDLIAVAYRHRGDSVSLTNALMHAVKDRMIPQYSGSCVP